MRPRRNALSRPLWLGLLLAAACSFGTGTRWESAAGGSGPSGPGCTLEAQRCLGSVLQRCTADGLGAAWTDERDCSAEGLVCAPTLLACTYCQPSQTFCDGQQARLCSEDGTSASDLALCDPEQGVACRNGNCSQLCAVAAEQRSNVGCEYWAVDLDNANVGATKNAAAQQFAVVVSNPQPDVPVEVVFTQDEGAVGGPASVLEIARETIAPLNLRVFKLGPREVDGSPEGEFDTGTHTALTRQAYRIRSDFPVVAYQFNPLENVNVFSNDASLLKPREALDYNTESVIAAYLVVGWPQTIAITDDPNTNFSAADPTSLRAFLTLVGTEPGTRVRIWPTTNVLGGGPVPATAAGEPVEATLDAYDVLNLETEDFLADFTGTLIEADGPVAVFSGGEASDAPHFLTLSDRRCCADHLEEQLDPIRTAGKTFALVHEPSRTRAVGAAGGNLGGLPEPEYVRFVAVRDGQTVVRTTLPSPDDELVLEGMGDWREVETTRDFMAESDQPIHVAQITASQDAANVPRGLPGGDPSLLVVPPREQFRPDYVFLTPDKYAFDFITVAAPPEALVLLDDVPLTDYGCEVAPADGLTAQERGAAAPELMAYRCQLSFPLIDPTTAVLSAGLQRDGVHRVVADAPVGVSVLGFDSYVSYAYAAGTQLTEIAPPR